MRRLLIGGPYAGKILDFDRQYIRVPEVSRLIFTDEFQTEIRDFDLKYGIYEAKNLLISGDELNLKTGTLPLAPSISYIAVYRNW